MIVAPLQDLARQVALNPRLKTALDWLAANAARSDLPERVEIDGKDVYALVQAYETAPAGEAMRLEAHQNYIDIQFIAAGEEVMGWAPVSELPEPTLYNPEKDVFHGNLPAKQLTPVLVKAGQAAIFYPADAHAPKLAGEKPAAVRKIVLKVRV
jgi:YhcH/YjgK/YiaL family protein